MDQGDQMNAGTRSQAEQAGVAVEEVGGIAWVGLQWRMDGYCGRANANPQQQCGAGNAATTTTTTIGTEPQAHPEQPETVGAEDESHGLPLSRRSKPVRRGPGQQAA